MNILIEYSKNYLVNKSGSIHEKKDKSESWRLKNLDEAVLNTIQIENETEILKNTSINFENEMTNEELLRVKGICQYFENVDKEFLKPRLCMGFLVKAGKNNIFSFKKRWFILVCEKPILNEGMENFQETEVLSKCNLPEWMEFNVIYYFKYENKEDSSKFCGSIPLKQCKGVQIDDLKKGAKESYNLTNIFSDFVKVFESGEKTLDYYSFKIILENKKISLYTDFITELNKYF